MVDLQLPMQSMSITTNVTLNPVHGEVYSIQHYVIKFVSDFHQASFLDHWVGFNIVFDFFSNRNGCFGLIMLSCSLNFSYLLPRHSLCDGNVNS